MKTDPFVEKIKKVDSEHCPLTFTSKTKVLYEIRDYHKTENVAKNMLQGVVCTAEESKKLFLTIFSGCLLKMQKKAHHR